MSHYGRWVGAPTSITGQSVSRAFPDPASFVRHRFAGGGTPVITGAAGDGTVGAAPPETQELGAGVTVPL